MLKEAFKKLSLVGVVITLLGSNFTSDLLAETLESPNYKIEGAQIGAGGGITDSTNYSLFSTIGEFSGNPRLNSTSYQLQTGNSDMFTAAVPTISCFEATSSGSSNCNSGPSYLNDYGMVRVCGSTGCYNRARFEINTEGNPPDTLYGVYISTDNFASNILVVDGTTFRPKSLTNKQLTDYQSKSDWESVTFNLEGLQSNTQYYLRVTALHGDFTESSPSPALTTTTANATLQFDLDITDSDQTTPETSDPYQISFSGNFKLFAGGALQVHDDLIWMDLHSNAAYGAAVVQRGEYGGLHSTNQVYTITSANADLTSVAEGFGIQNFDYSGSGVYQENYSGSGGSGLGIISVESNYNNSGHIVGAINSSFLRVYDGNGPIDEGRMALFVKAKGGPTTIPDNDYSETITFVAVGRY